MKYIVYSYSDEKGKFYYIGRGRVGREIENHKRVKVPPKERILILHKDLTKQQSVDYEKGLIKFYGRKIDGGILENLSIGGHCGSEGVPPWNKGKRCEYISKSNSKRIGELHPLFGKPLSEEVREKISKSNTGKKHSDEVKDKIRNKHSGVEKTEEHRKNISKGKKGMKQSETHRQNNSKSKCKFLYKIQTPTGDIIETENMRRFSIENNLPPASMHRLSVGEYVEYRGYKLIEKVHLIVKAT